MISSIEPSVIIKGDTVKWNKSFPDYSAPTWTLKYALRGAGSIDLTATPSGSNFAIVIAAAATAVYLAGAYVWAASVEQGAERYTVGSGSLLVKANPIDAALVGAETRTPAKVILDNLMAAYKTYTASQGNVKRYQIGDREMEYKDSASLLKDIQFWQGEVFKEEQVARLAAGLGGNPNTLFTRFRSPI